MFRKLNLTKFFLFVFLFSTVIVSPVAASNWNITSLDAPHNNFDVSNNTQTVQLVNLETEQYGTPISEDMLTESSEFNYLYNSSEGPILDMEHLDGGLWYAVLDTDLSKHSSNSAEVLYNASGVTKDDSIPDSNTPAEERQTIRIGNYTVDLLTDIQGDYIPGMEKTLAVNVTNLSNDAVINSSVNVKAYFTNGTWTSNDFSMEYNDTQERWLNESVQVPDNSNSTYVMRVLAYNRSADMQNAYGSTSRLIETAPNLEGEITSFEPVKGCSMDEGDMSCEPEGTAGVSFNVTSAEAENVELTGYKVNSSSGDQEEYYSRDITEDEGLYVGTLPIPEINTSVFEKVVVLKVNATKSDRSLVKERYISYDSFELTHTGSRSAVQGSEYDLTFQAVRPYSFDPLGQEDVRNLSVNLSYPNNELVSVFEGSDLSFDSETSTFSRVVEIPDDAPSGGWSLDFHALNVYGEESQLSSGFSVDASDATFEVNDTVIEKNDMEVEEFMLPVRNLQSSNLTLEANASENLSEVVKIGQEGRFNVSASNTTDVPVEVNLTEFKDVNGTVNLTDLDSGYETSIDLEIDIPDCVFESGQLCSLTDKWINLSADSRGVHQREINLYNNNDNSTNITVNATGNISELITFEPGNNSIEDRLTLIANYTVEQAGNYSGNILLNSTNGSALTYNTSLETNFSEIEEPEFSVSPSHVDIGVFPLGESRQGEVRLGNTGDSEIENITVFSNQFDVSFNVTNLNLSSETSKTVKLQFEEVTDSEGNLTVSGNSSEGLVTVNMTANATPVQNYADRTGELTERARSLRPVQDSNLSGTLNDISGTASNIEVAWDEGNYLRAEELFRQAQSNLDYVANNKQSTGGEEEQDPSDTGGAEGEPEDSGDDPAGGDDGTDPSTQSEEEGGGLPIIPIVAVFAVLLLIGFVVYESYIPEEGDPLYGVLGNQ